MSRIDLIFLSILLFIISEVITDDEDSRIVGGVETDISRIPYQVSVMKNNSLCGGSIIKPRFILTAAHCVLEGKPEDFKVHVGSNTYFNGTIYIPNKIVIHPEHKPQTKENDIAILRLSKQIQFSRKVRKINLARSLPKDNVTVTVSGYGRTAFNETRATSLKSVKLNIFNFDECKRIYNGRVFNGMFCASAPGKGACLGDSGGPVTYRNRLIGAVSWGRGCALPRYPSVYTNIPHYYNWIQGTTLSLT